MRGRLRALPPFSLGVSPEQPSDDGGGDATGKLQGELTRGMRSAMNPDEMTVEQHLSVLYLLDIAQGGEVSAVDVDGFSELPEGAVLLRVTQADRPRVRPRGLCGPGRTGKRRRGHPRPAGRTPDRQGPARCDAGPGG
jgi:hypothetical protein